MNHLLAWVQPKSAWREQGDSMLLPPAPVPGRLLRSTATDQWFWQVGEFVRGFHSREEGISFLGNLYDMLVKGVTAAEIEDDTR